MIEHFDEKTLNSFKIDGLTGVGNLLGFFDWVNQQIERSVAPYSIIALDIIGLEGINEKLGRSAGDAAIRWISYVIKEETRGQIYRAGDEFLITLTKGSHEDHAAEGRQIYEKLLQETERVNLQSPPANFAIIHYDQLIEHSPEDVLGAYYGALYYLKEQPDVSYKTFYAADMEPVMGLMKYIVRHTIIRLLSFGGMLEQSRQLAYTDSISGLPNIRAALENLSTAILQAEISKQPCSILLIDGDDLKPYNNISYAAGDEMIKRLGTMLKGALRPNDFLARWRYGDEFLVLLPNTAMREAKLVGERMRNLVQEGSMKWIYPITISLGAASFTKHGENSDELVAKAEKALNQAKRMGKNRLVEADPVSI